MNSIFIEENGQKSANWALLIKEAVQKPGKLKDSRRYFKKYSLLNQWLAASQMDELQPINTYKGWQELGRTVMKGEKSGVSLIMPVPVKGRKKNEEDSDDDEKIIFTKFMLRNYWFRLNQTEGEDSVDLLTNEEDPEWSLKGVFEQFNIKEEPFSFTSLYDVSEAYVKGQTISISPLHEKDEGTFLRIRESARIVLGHTSANPPKSMPMDKVDKDIEAEVTAYLVSASVGLDQAEYSRSRIQDLLDQKGIGFISGKSAHRAFGAADKIINAGYC